MKASSSLAWPDKIDRDQKYIGEHLYALESMVEAAAGPHYNRSYAPSAYTPENHYHSYTSLMVGRLIDDLPRVKCTTRRPGSQMEAAEAIRHGLNRWVRDVKYRSIGQLLAYDYCYCWGVAMVKQVPNRHMGRTMERWIFDPETGEPRLEKPSALWPAVYRIPQHQFIIDSRALTSGEAEYVGHIWFADAKSIVKEAERGEGWDMEALRSVAGGASPTGGSAALNDPQRASMSLAVDATEIEMVTLWVPGIQIDEKRGPDQGYHGALLTLGRQQGKRDGKYGVLRKQDYYGPPTGPYVIFGAYQLPNKLLPLGPLMAVEGQIRELNRQARALSRSAERYKRLILFDERDTRTAAKLKSATHDFFVGVPGFNSQKFMQAEIGGVTEAQKWQVAYHQDRLNRMSAMDEAQQGSVTGVGTATENQIAAGATETRLRLLRQGYSDATTRLLEKVAWYLYHDDRVVFPLGEDAAEDFNMEEPWFHGGLQGKDSDASYEDLELEIEAFSMQRSDEQSVKANSQAGIAFILETAALRSQLPFVDWDGIDEIAASVFNLPNLPGLIDNEAALQMQPFQEGGQAQQPRLGKDVGTQQQYSLSFHAPPRSTGPSVAQGMRSAGLGAAPAGQGRFNLVPQGAGAA